MQCGAHQPGRGVFSLIGLAKSMQHPAPQPLLSQKYYLSVSLFKPYTQHVIKGLSVACSTCTAHVGFSDVYAGHRNYMPCLDSRREVYSSAGVRSIVLIPPPFTGLFMSLHL